MRPAVPTAGTARSGTAVPTLASPSTTWSDTPRVFVTQLISEPSRVDAIRCAVGDRAGTGLGGVAGTVLSASPQRNGRITRNGRATGRPVLGHRVSRCVPLSRPVCSRTARHNPGSSLAVHRLPPTRERQRKAARSPLRSPLRERTYGRRLWRRSSRRRLKASCRPFPLPGTCPPSDIVCPPGSPGTGAGGRSTRPAVPGPAGHRGDRSALGPLVGSLGRRRRLPLMRTDAVLLGAAPGSATWWIRTRFCCCMRRFPFLRFNPRASRADLRCGPGLRAVCAPSPGISRWNLTTAELTHPNRPPSRRSG
jgi:hypothetical protein